MSPKMKYWTINNNLRLIWKAITVYYPPSETTILFILCATATNNQPFDKHENVWKFDHRINSAGRTFHGLMATQKKEELPNGALCLRTLRSPLVTDRVTRTVFSEQRLTNFFRGGSNVLLKVWTKCSVGSLWAHSVDPKQHQGPFVKVGWIVEHSLISFVLKMVTLRLQQSREQRRFKVCRFFMLQFCSDHISIKKNCKLKSTRQKSHTSWWMLLLALCELKYF